MEKFVKVTDECTIAGQPSMQDLSELETKGYKTVINFRENGEGNQPISPQEEERIVKDLGMEYIHFPMNLKTLTMDDIIRFDKIYSGLKQPVFAHCQRGVRAAVLLLINYAEKANMNGEEILNYADKLGIHLKNTDAGDVIRKFVAKGDK
ncbi:Beta-lactamase hydrolase-like protein [Candidatus Rubidus massiliensis]|nr:Beta-lactamase hydrolase-like protein [Candidatus Rubidus massiliensis]